VKEREVLGMRRYEEWNCGEWWNDAVRLCEWFLMVF
jgi:hypothetical protein